MFGYLKSLFCSTCCKDVDDEDAHGVNEEPAETWIENTPLHRPAAGVALMHLFVALARVGRVKASIAWE